MYELYSKRQNEQLRRRREERKDWDLGVTGGSKIAKRRVIVKRPPTAAATATKAVRKSLGAGDISIARAAAAYSLRSSAKKAPASSYSSSPPLAAPRAAFTGASKLITPRRSVGVVEKKVAVCSCRRN